MTEAEWLVCTDPRPMLEFLRGRDSDRKWRLFACACCRNLFWDLLPDSRVRHAISVNEAYADGLVNESVLETEMSSLAAARKDAVKRAANVPYTLDAAKSQEEKELDALEWAEWAVGKPEREFWIAEGEEQREHPCAFLRELFGNPFRLVTIDLDWLIWQNNTIPKMAQSIYDEGRFERMPILADALEEAGCTNADILNHCRQPGEHVRGCWVID
jgi:hypothetical protein